MKALVALAESRVFRFLVAGGAATLTHVTVFVILVERFELPAVFASIPAFLIALSVSYYGNRTWTFQSSGLHRIEFPKYALAAVNGLLLNVAITYVVVDLIGARYVFALVLVVTVVPIVTFFVSRKWVFARN
jgi:putative flippase GtrA